MSGKRKPRKQNRGRAARLPDVSLLGWLQQSVSRWNPRWVYLLLVSVPTLLGLSQILAFLAWRPVPATITRVELREMMRDRRGKPYVERTPIIDYTYRVGDSTYSGFGFSFLEWSSDNRADAEAAVAPYRAGGATTAYVMPFNPSSSFLARKIVWWPFGLAALTGVLVLLIERRSP
jgi:hypothetical protein